MTCGSNTRTSSVLIVDDDPVLRELFDAILHDQGIASIFRASDGNEALAVLEDHPQIDLVTLDLNMPQCDGIGFLRLASRQAYEGRIILISSEPEAIRNSAGRLANMLGLNCAAILPKPVDFARFSAFLKETAVRRVPATVQPEVNLDMVRDGLESGRMFAAYQPRVDIQSQRLAGAEALARIRGSDGGILNTEKAINLAEEHGLISDLTWRMAELICADFGAIRAALGRSLRISFNISGAVLSDQGFADRLAKLVRAHGHEPQSFILEVTETRIPSDQSLALEELTRARMNGFGIAIDDFGTGYSNITQIRQYPFTELKIDKEFLLNAEKDRFSRAAVEAGASLGRELGLLVVAEGVETISGLELARSCGANEGQGYLFAKPLPVAEFIERAGELVSEFDERTSRAGVSAA